MTQFDDPAVAAAYHALPEGTRAGALALRQLILETATSLPRAQPLQEALRWGAARLSGAQGIHDPIGRAQSGPLCPVRALPKPVDGRFHLGLSGRR
ncbi:hypothetical protein [Ruegeria faecimaris]|uniref:hypothetical protein n=1 Tax=Ruegeria faecimaris TaxID=686389 RepID=UPI002491A6E5|nr:hypothetical protein [Ruegeria faecimaris]